MAQDSPRQPKIPPRCPQDAPKMGSRCPQDGIKMASRWPQDGLKMTLKMGSVLESILGGAREAKTLKNTRKINVFYPRKFDICATTFSPSGLPLYSAKRAEHYHMKRSAQLVPRKSASRHPPMAPIGAQPRHPLPLWTPPLYTTRRGATTMQRSAQLVC